VARLRRAGAQVRTAKEDGVVPETAAVLAHWAGRAALLTLDQRLWDDQKNPLARSSGVIVLKFSPGKLDEAEQAFAYAQQTFGGRYRPVTWKGVKILATPLTCLLKMLAPDGTVVTQAVERSHAQAEAPGHGPRKSSGKAREAARTAA
jgi:hypothetical protein